MQFENTFLNGSNFDIVNVIAKHYSRPAHAGGPRGHDP
jgi:hypothetical protein